MFSARQSSTPIGPALGSPALKRFVRYTSPNMSHLIHKIHISQSKICLVSHQVGHCCLLLPFLSKLWPIIRDPDSRVWPRLISCSPCLVVDQPFVIEGCHSNGCQTLCAETRMSKKQSDKAELASRKPLSGCPLSRPRWGCPTSRPLSHLRRRRTAEHPSPDLCCTGFQKHISHFQNISSTYSKFC